MTSMAQKKVTRLRLDHLHPLEAMQVLPPAIMWKRNCLKESGMLVRITASGVAQELLRPYQTDMSVSPWSSVANETEMSINNLLADNRYPLAESSRRSFGFGSEQSFFSYCGFPKNSRGAFQEKLFRGRNDRTGQYIYYCQLHEADYRNELDEAFWSEFFHIKLPAMSHANFFGSEVSKLNGMANSLVEVVSHKACFWEIVTDLLLSRFYVGGYNVISELAMLLNVPCIILMPPPEHVKFPVERKSNVRYVKRNSSQGIDGESFLRAYESLERNFLSQP